MSPAALAVIGVLAGFALGYLLGRLHVHHGERVDHVPDGLPTVHLIDPAVDDDDWDHPLLAAWGDDPHLDESSLPPPPPSSFDDPDRRARIADALRHL